MPNPKPHILGEEADGTIIPISPTSSTSSTYDLKPGDRVVWLGTKGGAYTKYSTCPASKVYVLPSHKHIKPGIAATSLAQGLSALTFVKKIMSRVGFSLSQFLHGIDAHVIRTVGSREKLQSVVENGVVSTDLLLCYKDDDTVDRALEITGGEGVAAVFDGIGKTTFDMGLKVLTRDGTLVSYGNSSGDVMGFEIWRLLEKNLRLMRPSVFGCLRKREEFMWYSRELFESIGRAGKIY